MLSNEQVLKNAREEIDHVDQQILYLLQKRSQIVKDVIRQKIENKIPIYAPGRETSKIALFREKATQVNLDPDWAEDFLRMIMSSSRAIQSENVFPRSTDDPKTILFVGGSGGMGSLFARFADSSGHEVRNLEKDDWYRVDELCADIDLAIVTVPIHLTLKVIEDLAPYLPEKAILADFTSNKNGILEKMLAVHPGPVVSLHPMHGPDLPNLTKQLLLLCPGRDPESFEWLKDQFLLWGMRVKEVNPEKHDHAMHMIQGLRHFVALLHGSFMTEFDLNPGDMLDFSSPIYRAELMMNGRIFAQDPRLYADIVFSNQERRELLLKFFDHHSSLMDMVRNNDREGFVTEFQRIHNFFGEFAEQALNESGYLINRLSDRFVG